MKQAVLYSTGHRDNIGLSAPIPVRDISIKRNPHFVIQRDGFIDCPLLPAKGVRQLIVVMVGTRFFTPEQMDSLLSLYLKLRVKHGIHPEGWLPSHEAGGDTLDIDMDDLRSRFSSL